MGYIIQYESQGTAVNPWASNSTYNNVTGGSDLLTGRPQNLCPPIIAGSAANTPVS